DDAEHRPTIQPKRPIHHRKYLNLSDLHSLSFTSVSGGDVRTPSAASRLERVSQASSTRLSLVDPEQLSSEGPPSHQVSQHHRLAIRPKHFFERRTHLPQRRLRLDRVDQRGHEILVGGRGVLQRLE